jgi:DHA1 family tetracycline resistance protein-like MFS transporter
MIKLGALLRREFSFITGNYQILIVSWVIMDLAMEMPVPNFQYYVTALQGTGLALGIIGLASWVAMAVVAFPGGYLADKYGRRWLITTMTFIMALSNLFFAFAPSWEYILIGSIVHSLCLIYQPALFAMVQDSLPPERRGMGSSLIQLIHGTFNTPGPLIAGLLLLQFGLINSMRIIYILVTILYVIAAVWRLRLKETIINGDPEPIKFRYFISSYPKAVKESFGVWKTIPRSVLWLFVVQIFIMFGMSMTQVMNAIYATNVLGIPEEQWWLTFIPLLLTMIVVSIPVGKMVDKVGRRIPLFLGLCVFASAAVIFTVGNLVTVMIAMVLFATGQLLVMSSAMALSADLIDPVNRGKVVGFRNFVGYIFNGLGMLLGNYLYIAFFPQLPFYITFATMIPGLLIVAFLIHELKK